MRYKCIVTYDGTMFHGFQTQPNLRTVQEEIEKVLLQINKKKTIVYSSGRTDAGVHAIGQVFHFDSDIIMEEKNMANAINSRLPKDIYITSVEKVSSDFYARFSAKAKEYHYLIDFGPYDPLKRNYRYYFRYKNFSLELFKEAGKLFLGEHDFKAFTKNHNLENTVRTIYSISFEEEGTLLKIKVIGSGFMHNMVRIMVAMMLEVGKKNITIEDLKNIIEDKDRRKAPKIAPANGLYLYKVFYE